jgi:putative hemolysin
MVLCLVGLKRCGLFNNGVLRLYESKAVTVELLPNGLRIWWVDGEKKVMEWCDCVPWLMIGSRVE